MTPPTPACPALPEWPHMASKLGVDVSPGSWQLPSVIMFEDGQEQMRVPRRKGRELSKELMIKAFELDMRLAVSMRSHKGGKKSD